MNGRLYRSRRDRMLAGVAGGLAEQWGADPSLVRIVWALLVLFTGGIALLVYIVMAIVVPEGDDAWYAGPPPGTWPGSAPTGVAGSADQAPPAPDGTGPDAQAWAARQAEAEARWAERRAARRREGAGSANGALIGGGLLIVVGVFFLLREFLPSLDVDWFWPLVLVALGVVLLLSALRRDDGRGGQGGAS